MSQSGAIDLEVVIEEDEVLALGRGDAGVDARREVEQAKALERDHAVARALDRATRRVEQRGGAAPAQDKNQLVAIVRRLVDHAADRLGEQIDGGASGRSGETGRRDDERDERRVANAAPHSIQSRSATGQDLRVHAGSSHVILEREPPRIESPRLGQTRARGRLWKLSPVIQDARNVVHDRRAFRPIDNAQEKVVILGALVAGPETADLLEDGPPDDHQVAGIHARQEVIG